jgi:hypothetical protein
LVNSVFFRTFAPTIKTKENYMGKVYLRYQIVGDGTGNMSQEVPKENMAVHTSKHFYVIRL